MKWIFFLLSFLSGIAMSVQSGINSQLKSQLNHPIFASLISFVVGLLLLICIIILQKQPIPSFSELTAVSAWKYTGGFLGAMIVTVSLLSIAQIGASSMFVTIIAGQLLAALIMDHCGLLGLPVVKISTQKIIGIVLLIAGVYLVNKK